MAIDINEARLIIEEAKKRGMIRMPGEAAPVKPAQADWEKPDGERSVLPGWLLESIQNNPARD